MDYDKDAEKESLVLKATGWTSFYVPSQPQSKYAVVGAESQVISIHLDVGDMALKAEPGVMTYMTNNVSASVTCEGCCSRCCAGEACYAVNYTAGDNGSFIGLSPNFPTAKVVPVDLSSPDVGGTLIAQTGAFMASYGEVNIDVSFDCNLVRCCCGGLGLARQKLHGNGTAFLAATGTIVQKVLLEGETIVVDNQCVLAHAGTVTLDVRRTGGIVGMVGGGEGIFNSVLTGPGLVMVQSMSERKFLEALAADKIWRR